MVFEPEFCDQSRNTLPGRFALVIVAVTSSGCSACSASATSLASAVVPSLSRLGPPPGPPSAGRWAYRCSPLLPLVTGEQDRSRSASASRTSSATRAHSWSPAGSPGSRSITSRSGWRGVPSASTVHWWTCSSSAARLASQVSVARSSQIGKRRVPSPLPVREPVVGTSAVRTHDGVPAGAFFSKKLAPSTPCGQRMRVTARSRRCGSSTGATWA